jgi:hypothetical protein
MYIMRVGLIVEFILKPFKLMHCHNTIIMSFLIYFNQFDVRNVYLEPPASPDVKMSRLIYSTPRIALNNIGFAMHLVPTKVIQHYKDEWSMHFDAGHPVNAGIIEQFRSIESDIINKFMHPGLAGKRHCIYANTLADGCIKTDNETDVPTSSSSADVQFILYVLGIWETPTEFGIACRFAKW